MSIEKWTRWVEMYSEEFNTLADLLNEEECDTLAVNVRGGTWVWYSDNYKGRAYIPEK